MPKIILLLVGRFLKGIKGADVSDELRRHIKNGKREKKETVVQ